MLLEYSQLAAHSDHARPTRAIWAKVRRRFDEAKSFNAVIGAVHDRRSHAHHHVPTENPTSLLSRKIQSAACERLAQRAGFVQLLCRGYRAEGTDIDQAMLTVPDGGQN